MGKKGIIYIIFNSWMVLHIILDYFLSSKNIDQFEEQNK